MNWIAISGSWQKINKKVEKDVRQEVKKILERGDGIVSGGALNVDYLATDEALKYDPSGGRVKIFIPATLDIYAAHYRQRAEQGIITKQRAEDLIAQLRDLKALKTAPLIENQVNKVVDKKAYFERNSAVINVADELVAFHVNKSEGVINTIAKAKKKGIPIKIFSYTIMNESGFKITKIKSFKETEKALKYEFKTRATPDYIYIKGKKGAVFGEHWHEGKVTAKSPEVVILLEGKARLFARHIKTKQEQEEKIKGPVIIEIYPFWYHEMKALTDVIFLDLGSLKDHLVDRKE